MATNPKLKDIAMSWCLRNGIKIYLNPIDNSRAIIEYRQGLNPPQKGKKVYKSRSVGKQDDKWWEKIEEMYIEIYKSSNPNLDSK